MVMSVVTGIDCDVGFQDKTSIKIINVENILNTCHLDDEPVFQTGSV